MGVERIFRRTAFAVDRWRRRNRIQSTLVSPKCVKGTDISIGLGTSIDSASSIGSYSYVGNHCQVTKATVGRYVSIGSRVSVGLGEHDWRRLSTSALFYADAWAVLTEGDCEIGSDAWIGVNAVVRRGSRVGTGAVVGASAVVTEDVPDFAIVAGIPARLIRYRFPEVTQARLKASKWWEREIDDARALLDSMSRELGIAELRNARAATPEPTPRLFTGPH